MSTVRRRISICTNYSCVAFFALGESMFVPAACHVCGAPTIALCPRCRSGIYAPAIACDKCGEIWKRPFSKETSSQSNSG